MKRVFAFWVLFGCAVALSTCDSADRIVSLRVTLEVETPEGMRVGSSTVEQRVAFSDGFWANLLPGGYPMSAGVRGEATAIDLGERGILFALLARDAERDSSLAVDRLIFGLWPRATDTEPLPAWIDRIEADRPAAIIPSRMLPLLVRFRDIADPGTAERVDPTDLARSFGSEVSLRRATLVVLPGGYWPFDRIGWPAWATRPEVTHAIRSRLPWLGHDRETRLRPASDPLHPDFPATLEHGDFTRDSK